MGFSHGRHLRRAPIVEIFARGSAVFGRFGDGSELSGGVNWYVNGETRLEIHLGCRSS